jgi:gas vesicle protein
MKISTQVLVSNVQRYLKKIVIGVAMLLMAWQSTALAGDLAIVAPILATSTDSLSKEVTGKVDEVKGQAKQAIGKAQSGMEDKAGSVKSKVKDGMTEAKIAVDDNNARIENTVDKASDRVKGFFGK